MSNPVIAVVAVARCAHERSMYGIRFEQAQPGNWHGDWAFPIKEGQAKRERFDRTVIEGEIRFAPAYPGCPGCGSGNVYLCNNCGKLNCWDAETIEVTCAWCGQSGRIEGIIRSLEAGRDL